MAEYTIILHTLEQTSDKSFKESSVAVAYDVNENLDQLFKRIEGQCMKRFKKDVYWSDWIEIRKNNIIT
jgi:hypothetical protein